MKRTKRIPLKAPNTNPVLVELKKLRDDQLTAVSGGGPGPKNCGACCD